MRFPDRPDVDPSSDDSAARTERRGGAPGLAERLLRLPAGHPSGADARPARADTEPEDAVSHLPWPDDWVRHEGSEPGDVADSADVADPADAADPAYGADPADGEVKAGAGGQPERGQDGAGWAEAGRSPVAGAEAREGRDPYRPWFTGGDAAEPWFAGDPEWPSSDPGG
jgi:hypothetical protein